MKEIKFRAWNGNTMLFYENWFTLHYQNVLCFTNSEQSYVDESDIDYPSRVTLMQYTGLKDKNGKKIYEGDIVRSRHGIATVEFHNASFVFKWDFHTLNELMHTWKEDSQVQVEVIGNIWEHPDLLPTHPTSEISD